MRIITFSERLTSTNILYKENDILNFYSVVIMIICTLMFKIHKKNVPMCISNLFQVNTDYHEHNTRNKTQLQNKIGKQEFMYETFSFQGVYIWNKISNYMNTDVLKRQVNIFLRNN